MVKRLRPPDYGHRLRGMVAAHERGLHVDGVPDRMTDEERLAWVEENRRTYTFHRLKTHVCNALCREACVVAERRRRWRREQGGKGSQGGRV